MNGQRPRPGASGGREESRLAEYHRRRDFSRTAEPGGSGAPTDGEPRFVVQIHDASRMHFDFRLEADGVLKSWAVPKGPSTDPQDKRLAMPTEDHPLDYRDFEGVIAEGEYGAGSVIIWDEGTYRHDVDAKAGRSGDGSVAEALRRGHLSFRLNGSKLRGGFALTRFRPGDAAGRGEAWLLVKRADGRAPGGRRRRPGTPDPTRARSARTGRTVGQVAAEEGRT
ncbi:DNA polymerase ligase N-terminal domain-containing protein [Streptomyces marincola]|uniref:3'-phosphoesterase n=1 Tax=Streptomyces marincola TaxID=2878388 RepID=A0A1W7D3Y9_9ACTN|nr:DNA polymerase ligase N-terminal domain-containing protein [Streptomyces marincola]ARQ71813.1 3'-phosphoesterase [Streptomyces marincola]